MYSFGIHSGTPGSGTLLTPISTSGGVSIFDLSQSGSYYVQVMSTLNAKSIGSYLVQLVAAPVPEPSGAALSVAELAVVGLLVSLLCQRTFKCANAGCNGGSRNVDGFGVFNQTVNYFDGFKYAQSQVTFTLTDNSGSWANAAGPLTAC